MRKGFTPAHFLQARFFASLLFTALCLSYTQINAQTIGKGTYRDGFPRFLSFDPMLTQNVALTDTVVSLVALPNVITDPDTFVLSGVDWRYPNTAPALLSPTDIEKVPEALEPSSGPQDYYFITDPPARKIYLLNTAAPSIENSFGGLGVFDKPVAAVPYPDTSGKFKVIITDQSANAVIQIDWTFKSVDWRIDNTVLTGPNQLSAPSDAAPLGGGREVLICDTGRNRVMVVDVRTRGIVWEFTKAPNDNLSLNTPVDVEVDPRTGFFVITDQNNHRVLMVDRSTKENRWQFGTGQAGLGSDKLNSPTDVNALSDGNVLISDAGNKRLIEVNGQTRTIVYTFAHLLEDLRAANRIVENVPDQNKTLVIASNLPISQNALPFRLAYANEFFDSDPRKLDFSTPADFDSLGFPRASLDAPAGTRIRLQLRSANVITELNNAKWYGPRDTLDFYTGPTTAVNRVHDGHRFIQYRVFLDNDDNAQKKSNPLLTPLLRRVKVSAHYFDTNTTGTITSTAIRDTAKLIITSWRKLIVNSVLPADPQQRTQIQITVNIRDESNQNTLFGALLSSTTGLNQFDLALVDLLRRKQAVRLQAVLKTNNSSITPKLNDWQLEWENTQSTASSLKFTDPSGRSVDYYRVPSVADNPPLNVGTVFLSLDDLNLLPIEDAVTLQIRAARSGDQQTSQLTEQPSGLFILSPGYPAVMTDQPPNRFNVLEGKSTRDTLTVRYVDPTDLTDISTARVLMIQNVKGTIQIENPGGIKVDTVAVNDSLFVHIIGETDRDFSLAQDSLVVKFFNTLTSDTEELKLYEVANAATKAFDTGEFRGRFGIQIVKSTGGLVNDGKLQVSGGDQVRAEFLDLDDVRLQVVVQVRPALEEPNIFALTGNKAFDFFVAPNPYNSKQHANDGLRLGVAANTGDVLVRRIEIYNLAGERVRSLDGAEIPFRNSITRGQAAATPKGNYWWNLRTDSGAPVASGTYWAKISLRFTDSATGKTQETTTMRKFVIVQ